MTEPFSKITKFANLSGLGLILNYMEEGILKTFYEKRKILLSFINLLKSLVWSTPQANFIILLRP